MKKLIHKRYPVHYEDVEQSIVSVSKEEYLGLKELVRTLRKRIDELEKERMKYGQHNKEASGR
jgi:hypothetical protein